MSNDNTLRAALGELTEAEKVELLDWVSSCQSAYHIESTKGHRFGGLPSMLVENRGGLIEYVNGCLRARAALAPSSASTLSPDARFRMDDPGDNDKPTTFYVDEVEVGSVNYDEHGYSGIEAAKNLFSSIAVALSKPATQPSSAPEQAESVAEKCECGVTCQDNRDGCRYAPAADNVEAVEDVMRLAYLAARHYQEWWAGSTADSGTGAWKGSEAYFNLRAAITRLAASEGKSHE